MKGRETRLQAALRIRDRVLPKFRTVGWLDGTGDARRFVYRAPSDAAFASSLSFRPPFQGEMFGRDALLKAGAE